MVPGHDEAPLAGGASSAFINQRPHASALSPMVPEYLPTACSSGLSERGCVDGIHLVVIVPMTGDLKRCWWGVPGAGVAAPLALPPAPLVHPSGIARTTEVASGLIGRMAAKGEGRLA